MDYPDFDVRSASIEATGYFLMAYFKSGDAAVAEKFSDGLTMFLDTLVGIVKEEEEHQVIKINRPKSVCPSCILAWPGLLCIWVGHFTGPNYKRPAHLSKLKFSR